MCTSSVPIPSLQSQCTYGLRDIRNQSLEKPVIWTTAGVDGRVAHFLQTACPQLVDNILSTYQGKALMPRSGLLWANLYLPAL